MPVDNKTQTEPHTPMPRFEKISLMIYGLLTLAGAVIWFASPNLGLYIGMIGMGGFAITIIMSKYFHRLSIVVTGIVLIGIVIAVLNMIGFREGMNNQLFGKVFRPYLLVAVAIFLCLRLDEIIFAARQKKKGLPFDDIDVVHESQRKARTALGGVAILMLSTAIAAFGYLDGAKELFKGAISLTTVVLFSVGFATFYWAAQSNHIKAVQITEQIKDGKRRDRDDKRRDEELRLANRRDTAQLIINASAMLSKDNTAERFAAIAFLNEVAMNTDGPFRDEAFQLIVNFVENEGDKSPSNTARMSAIQHLEDLCGKFDFPRPYTIDIIERGIMGKFKQAPYFPNLAVSYENVWFKSEKFQSTVNCKGYIIVRNCYFYKCKIYKNIIIENNVTFSMCDIYGISINRGVLYKEGKDTEKLIPFDIVPESYIFKDCSFSKCEFLPKIDKEYFSDNSDYDEKNPPAKQVLEEYGSILTSRPKEQTNTAKSFNRYIN